MVNDAGVMHRTAIMTRSAPCVIVLVWGCVQGANAHITEFSTARTTSVMPDERHARRALGHHNMQCDVSIGTTSQWELRGERPLK
jgi:hypothetical protein